LFIEKYIFNIYNQWCSIHFLDYALKLIKLID